MFDYLTLDNAPEASKPLIDRSVKTYDFFPTLHALLANSPAAYKAYLETFNWFENETALTPLEQQVVFMSASVFNRCYYCVPGHTYLMKATNMPDDVINSLRNDQPINDPKLEALRRYTKSLLQHRGHIEGTVLKEFFAAGYNQQQALDVLVGLASKLISNFANAITNNPPEEATKAYQWDSKAEGRC